ncbi:MAG TPA: YciI family protein [Rhizomicrobium sp.]|nr:YciI family protein [Rhizomicrobium sp.]
MLYVLTAIDKPNSLALRMATRAAHFEYVHGSGVVKLGGPFLDAKGDMAGSLVIFEAADLDAARVWAANDPYARAGLFAQSELRPWRATYNEGFAGR